MNKNEVDWGSFRKLFLWKLTICMRMLCCRAKFLWLLFLSIAHVRVVSIMVVALGMLMLMWSDQPGNGSHTVTVHLSHSTTPQSLITEIGFSCWWCCQDENRMKIVNLMAQKKISVKIQGRRILKNHKLFILSHQTHWNNKIFKHQQTTNHKKLCYRLWPRKKHNFLYPFRPLTPLDSYLFIFLFPFIRFSLLFL